MDRTTKLKGGGAFAALLLLAVMASSASPGFSLGAAPRAIGRSIGKAIQAARDPGSARDSGGGDARGASRFALADIPARYLRLYTTAAHTCPRLTWQLLAGIGKAETDHGRARAPGVSSGLNHAGCCAGPMQFNLRNGPPTTWATYGHGGNPYDPRDAIPAAARLLCAAGLAQPPPPADPCPQVLGTAAVHAALKRYNNACWYAHEVVTLAARYTTSPASPAGGAGGVALPASRDPFVAALAHNPRITTTRGRGCDPAPDLASGRLDLRVQSLLAVLAERWPIRLSCLHTGHSRYVKGTRRVSNHTVWRAVDIDQVAGQPVSPRSAAALAVVRWLDGLQGPLRPGEVGSPFDLGHRPYFTDEGHTQHIHIGYPHDTQQ